MTSDAVPVPPFRVSLPPFPGRSRAGAADEVVRSAAAGDALDVGVDGVALALVPDEVGVDVDHAVVARQRPR